MVIGTRELVCERRLDGGAGLALSAVSAGRPRALIAASISFKVRVLTHRRDEKVESPINRLVETVGDSCHVATGLVSCHKRSSDMAKGQGSEGCAGKVYLYLV